MFILLLKRLAVFVFGVGLAYLTIFTVFPLVDNQLPLAIAILLTYCFVAYVGLPALIRFSHLLDKPKHIPTRTHASDGWAVDTINIVVLARSEREFIAAMHDAGWAKADKLTFKTSVREVWSIIFNRPYPTAPFGNYFVFGRKQDLGFQIQLGNSPRHRHHVRFWKLGTTVLHAEHEHHGFWRKLLKRFLHKQKQVWVGAAILDKGISIRKRDLQLNHGIESDTRVERDFLVSTLQNAGTVQDVVRIKAGEPLHTSHQGFGEVIISDGYVTLCALKRRKKRS